VLLSAGVSLNIDSSIYLVEYRCIAILASKACRGLGSHTLLAMVLLSSVATFCIISSSI